MAVISASRSTPKGVAALLKQAMVGITPWLNAPSNFLVSFILDYWLICFGRFWSSRFACGAVHVIPLVSSICHGTGLTVQYGCDEADLSKMLKKRCQRDCRPM